MKVGYTVRRRGNKTWITLETSFQVKLVVV